MFHHSTTIHHQQQFSFTFFREKRLVHVGKLREWHVKSGAYWESSPVRAMRRTARYYSWAFGIPPLKRVASYTFGAAGQVLGAAERGYHTGIEAGKGALQMTASPAAMVAYSGLVLPKRMLVDVPWATFKASVKTPLAALKSPINFVSGVWESMTKTRENVSNVLSSVLSLSPSKIYQSTRQAVSDVFVHPVSKTLAPVVQPAWELGDTALGAYGQVLSTIGHAAPEMVGRGWDRIMAAPANGNNIYLEKQGIRAAARKADQEEKEAKKKAYWDAVKGERGEQTDKAA